MSLTKVASSMLASGGGAGGSSVGKNYISSYNNGTCNGDFETGNASGWNICSVASITNGVPATLSLTGSGVTTSVINTGQLAGQYSYQTVFSSTSALNGFCSDIFTIDLEDQAKVLTFKFYYNVTANAASGNFSGTSSNTFIVAIYDQTAGSFIQPAGLYSMVQSSGSGIATGTFQTPLGSSQYRLVVLCANNPSANITVVWDDFFLGPQISVNAPAVSDWQSYTPTFTGLGTTTSVGFNWRRVGDSVEIQGKFTVGTATATEARISLPSGLTVSDTTKIPSLSKVGSFTTSYIEAFAGEVLTEPSVTYITLGKQGSGTAGLQKLNGNSLFGTSGQICSLFARIPIAGWSSNSVASNDTDTRVVAAAIKGLATTSLTTGNPYTFNTVEFDTHGAYNTSTYKYVVPVSGIYRVTVSGAYSASPGDIILTKNNTVVIYMGTTSGSRLTCSGIVQAVAGDELWVQSGMTITTATGAQNGIRVQYERLSGPAVITATETVAASYWAGSNGTSTSTTAINFDLKEYDTHNAVTSGSNWKFTAPVSGTYNVSFFSNQVTGTTTYYYIYKNSTTTAYKVIGYTSGTFGLVGGASTSLKLNAGDYIGIYTGVSTPYYGNASLSSNLMSNISITRTGN